MPSTRRSAWSEVIKLGRYDEAIHATLYKLLANAPTPEDLQESGIGEMMSNSQNTGDHTQQKRRNDSDLTDVKQSLETEEADNILDEKETVSVSTSKKMQRDG